MQVDSKAVIKSLKNLANSEHRYALIAKYIINNIEKIIGYRIYDLAKNTYYSPATISRFVKFLGLNNYSELQHILRQYLNIISGDYLSFSYVNDKIDYLEAFYKNTTNSIHSTHSIINNKKINKVVELLINCKEIIILVGLSSIGPVWDWYGKLIRLGLNVKFSFSDFLQTSYCQYSTKDSLVIAISYSGINDVVLENLKIAKNNQSKIISITKQTDNEISSIANLSLFILSNESIERYISLTSHLVLIYLLDVILLTIIENLDYQSLLGKIKMNSPSRRFLD